MLCDQHPAHKKYSKDKMCCIESAFYSNQAFYTNQTIVANLQLPVQNDNNDNNNIDHLPDTPPQGQQNIA